MIARPPHVVLGAGWTPALIYNPETAPVGGAPFCNFRGSPTISYLICYPPNFIKTAYDFPTLVYSGSLGTVSDGYNGTGSTIVIVDAFGSPTIASDLIQFDTSFSLPAPPSFTVLCGPTWTGAVGDHCPTYNATAPAGTFDELGWSEEITLDVTTAHALAPGANIVLVVSNSDFDSDLTAAEMAVVSNPTYAGSIMTQSFGEPDNVVGCTNYPTCTTFDPTIKASFDNVYRLAALNGWTVLASSGDDGANEGYNVWPHGDARRVALMPGWPATSGNVLAVGGTQGLGYGGQYGPLLQQDYLFNNQPVSCAASATCNTGLVVISGGANGCTNATRPGEPTGCMPTGYGGEGAWQEVSYLGPRSSSGGGVSTLYARPAFQGGLTSTYSTLPSGTVTATGRTTPDVAFNAAVNGGVLAYMNDYGSDFGACNPVCTGTPAWLVFGGTSAASPAWAAIIAILNQEHGSPVGYINPAIYSLALSSAYSTAFHDVTAGNNTDCPATANFPPSGLYLYDCGINYGPPYGVYDAVTPKGFPAVTGYDLTTGWGTPDVSAFITAFLAMYATNNGNIDLPVGWNMFSVPEIPINTAIGSVLATLIADNSFDVVWVYQGGKWVNAMQSGGKVTGALKTIVDGQGYWIHMTEHDTLTYSVPSTGLVLPLPPKTPPTYSLPLGWNLVGFKPQPTIVPIQASTYLGSINTKYDAAHVYIYDTSTAAWSLVTPTTDLEPGQAIWVYMTAAATLTP